MGDEEEERGFTIVDKRGREDDEAAAGTAEQPAATAPVDGPSEARGALPRADFASLVLGLGQSALFHLGLMEDPDTGQPVPANLPVARHTIDSLEVLEEKTRGNLDPEEEQLLENLLADLRMRYVEAAR